MERTTFEGEKSRSKCEPGEDNVKKLIEAVYWGNPPPLGFVRTPFLSLPELEQIPGADITGIL